MNQIGIYFAYWEREWEADYCRYIQKVKSCGFDVLEIAAGSLPALTSAERERIAREADEQGISLTYCIGLPARYDLASPQAEVRREGIAYVRTLLEYIHTMGGDVLGGILYSAWPANMPSYEEKQRARERSIASLRELAGAAESFGVRCCLEVVNRFEQYLLNTVQEGLGYVEEIGSPFVKLLLDTFHMNIEEDRIGDAIRLADKQMGHFHIGECNRKVPGPETGHMPWQEIWDALRDVSYSGRIVMEPFVTPGGQVGRDIHIHQDYSENAGETELDARAAASCAWVRDSLQKRS